MAGIAQFPMKSTSVESRPAIEQQLGNGPEAPRADVYFGWLGISLAFLGGLWFLGAEQATPKVLDEARRAIDLAREAQANAEAQIASGEGEKKSLREQITELDELSDWLVLLHETSKAIRNGVEGLLLHESPLEAENLQSLTDSVERALTQLIGFEGQERWSLSIYQHVDGAGGKLGRLKCVARQCADKSKPPAGARTWGVGEGVVGHCMLTGKEIVVPNARDLQRSGWLFIPDPLKRGGDDVHYVSLAATPIRIAGQASPWGVVVASTDKPDRFGIDEDGEGSREVEPLRLLSNMVALIATRHYMRAPPRGN